MRPVRYRARFPTEKAVYRKRWTPHKHKRLLSKAEVVVVVGRRKFIWAG